MTIHYIRVVSPTIKTVDNNGDTVAVEYTPALVEFDGEGLPNHVCAFYFRGEWYNRAMPSESSDYERRFKTGDFLP